MKNLCAHICASLLLALASHAACAQSPAIPVTPDNFNRAESDMVFAGLVKDGALGKFVHHREPLSIDFPVVRPNRDTLYSMAVFDLDAGPVTITLPNAGTRFMALQASISRAKLAAKVKRKVEVLIDSPGVGRSTSAPWPILSKTSWLVIDPSPKRSRKPSSCGCVSSPV